MSSSSQQIEQWLKVLGVAGAIASFVWGVFVWKEKSEADRDLQRIETERLAQSRRIEATKPFLERQLKLYTEATEVAAVIATSSDEAQKSDALERFWQLYWGELALVENKEVEQAMVALGEAIKAKANRGALEQASLRLARACRRSLDNSWGITAWSNPDAAMAPAEKQENGAEPR